MPNESRPKAPEQRLGRDGRVIKIAHTSWQTARDYWSVLRSHWVATWGGVTAALIAVLCSVVGTAVWVAPASIAIVSLAVAQYLAWRDARDARDEVLNEMHVWVADAYQSATLSLSIYATVDRAKLVERLTLQLEVTNRADHPIAFTLEHLSAIAADIGAFSATQDTQRYRIGPGDNQQYRQRLAVDPPREHDLPVVGSATMRYAYWADTPNNPLRFEGARTLNFEARALDTPLGNEYRTESELDASAPAYDRPASTRAASE